jgi:hypothetical protein
LANGRRGNRLGAEQVQADGAEPRDVLDDAATALSPAKAELSLIAVRARRRSYGVDVGGVNRR